MMDEIRRRREALEKATGIEVARCGGEIIVTVKFITGAVGQSNPAELMEVIVNDLKRDLVKRLGDMEMWDPIMKEIEYAPFKELQGPGIKVTCEEKLRDGKKEDEEG